MKNIQLGILNREVLVDKKQNSGNPSYSEQTGSFVCLKNKTPVISRSFNHQSKNEQFTLLLRSILCMCLVSEGKLQINF